MGSDRAKFEDDFFFVRDLLSDFFDRGSIKRALGLIDEVGITGWEKWWYGGLEARSCIQQFSAWG